jgi:hypothetical protein
MFRTDSSFPATVIFFSTHGPRQSIIQEAPQLTKSDTGLLKISQTIAQRNLQLFARAVTVISLIVAILINKKLNLYIVANILQ